MTHSVYIFFILALLSLNGYTQSLTDTLELAEVEILAKPLSLNQQKAAIRFDSSLCSQYANRTLADLLQQAGLLFIRSAGSGTLATLHLRGSSGAQSPVLWEDLPLNSPMNGNLDLNLVPSSFFEQIALETHGNAAAWGSGVMGGSLQLSNPQFSNPGFKASFASRWSSLNNQSADLSAQFGAKRLFLSTKMHIAKDNNTFKFVNTAKFGNPIELQDHAKLNQTAVLQRLAYQLTPNQWISATIWLQQSARNLPQAITAAPAKQSQNDSIARFIVRHFWHQSKWSFDTKLALFNEGLHFQDQAINLSDRSNSKFLVFDSRSQYKINEFKKIQFNVQAQELSGQVRGFLRGTYTEQNHRQNRLATSIWYRHQFSEKLQYQLNARSEWVNNQFTLPTANFFALYEQTGIGQWHLQIANTFRVPTLNDLYWVPGGNPELLPEKGLTTEFGFKKRKAFNRLHVDATALIFFNRYHDLIQWLPFGNIWRPVNQNRLDAKGLQGIFSAAYLGQKQNIKIDLNYNQTFSTIHFSPSQRVEWQFYMPRTTLGFNAFYQRGPFQTIVSMQYVGKRPIVADATAFLPAFYLWQSKIAYSLLFFNKYDLTLSFEVQNLFNIQYQAIAWRPMPGRFFQFQTNFQF